MHSGARLPTPDAVGNGGQVALGQRIADHNFGRVFSTKGHRPWHHVYTEAFLTKNEALRREKFLKSGKGRKWLDENIPG